MTTGIKGGSESWIEANGIRIHCRVDGTEGRPWIVFSNSVATDITLWDDQVAALASSYRILRYDHRGHGATSAPESPYSFAELAADAAAVLEAFNVRDAVFVGISIGGGTAMLMGARHADRLRAVVPCDAQWATAPGNHAAWAERVAIARDKGMEAMVEPTIGRWFTAESRAAKLPQIDRVRQMIRTTPVAGFAGCAAALQEYDHRDDVKALRMPTLFLTGAKDGQVPRVMREMQAAVPGSRVAEIAEAGHLPNIERPAAFNKPLIEFLDTVYAA